MRSVSVLAAIAFITFAGFPAFAVEVPPAAREDATIDIALLRSTIGPFGEAIDAAEAAPLLPRVRPVHFFVAQPRIVITVSLADQSMIVRLDGSEIHSWPVSTGRSGYDTPTGAYRPYRLATMWRSRQYEDAPMPFSIFFEAGYAIHGTSSVRALGSVASHGCVRLATENAETLFNLTREVGSAEVRIVIAD